MRADADSDVQNALARLQLCSAALHTKALPLLAVKHQPLLNHPDRDLGTRPARRHRPVTVPFAWETTAPNVGRTVRQ